MIMKMKMKKENNNNKENKQTTGHRIDHDKRD